MSDVGSGAARSAQDLEQWIVAQLSARLKIEPRAIDRRERFNRFGLDSMKATALTKDLAVFLGRPLPLTLLWEHPSVDRLVKHLTSAVPAATAPAAAAGPSRAAGVPGVVREPIAVVGMACRFPMAADPEAYWRLLMGGVDAIREVPSHRWNLDRLYDEDPAAPGKMSTRWGGFLDHIDRFDAPAFGISPREASHMDPQQRLVLELCSEALDDAGFRVDRLKGSSTGVFLGAMWSDYARLIAGDPALITQHTATGQDTSIIAGRVSYFFGLQGPSLTVNTACSSSLVAVHLACQSLRSGESTLALAGGVSLIVSPESTIAMSKFGAMAPDGRSKAFDARANGYVRGEGAGVVVLKPLSRALADGDPIYCLVIGSAVNNDGFSNGLTAPNPEAQERVLRAAYVNANVPPDRVQYVEAHGTGTLLGDPIEAGALGAALGAGRTADRRLAIGSVKTNIGHLEAAAGIAGLIKVALAATHRQLPPTLHYQQPNPHIAFDELNLRVQAAPGDWPAPDEPLIAGVSSFGFGGTNCHVVLQGFGQGRAQVLPLTAPNDVELGAAAGAVARRLDGGESVDALMADCQERFAGAAASGLRAAAVFTGRSELRRKLVALESGQRDEGVFVGTPRSEQGRLVFVCSGHGSQWPGMTQSLLEAEPVFRAALEECGRSIEAIAGWNAIDELTANPAVSRINQFELTQPLLFAIQVSLAALWRSWGVEPDAVIGHSMGEVAAACIAGALSIDDAARVICHRSRLLGTMVGQGSIAVLGLSREDVQRRFSAESDRLWVAACNGPSTTAVSGEPALLKEIVAALQKEDIFARIANADVPAHSPRVDPLRAELFEAIRGIVPHTTRAQMFSTVTAAPISGSQLGPSYWVRNLREPVLFAQAVDVALDAGCRTFIELSPHPVLASAIEQSLARKAAEGLVLASCRREEDERQVLVESLARLAVSGHPVRWTNVGSRSAAAAASGQLAGTSPIHAAPVPIAVSAHSAKALRERARSLADYVRTHPDVSVADVSYTTLRRRSILEHRAIVVAASPSELADRLDAFHRGEERAGTTSAQGEVRTPRIAFVFSGQGPQWWGMGRDLSRAHDVFREALEQCDRLIRRHVDWSLIEELGRDEGSSRIDRLDIAQPSLFSIQVALAAAWKAWGLVPDVVVGHSMGEVAASYVAGVLTLENAVQVAVHRGRLVQRLAGRGRMASIEASAAEAAEIALPYGSRLAVAAINGPRSCVVSGEPSAVAEVVAALEQRGRFARQLRVDFASHGPQMDPLLDELTDVLSNVSPSAATVPIYSTLLGRKADGWEFDASYWARNSREPVQFAAAFTAMLDDIDVAVEIGPHPVLSGAMSECAQERGRSVLTLPTIRRDQPEHTVMIGSAGALFANGRELNWDAILPPGGRCVSLPPSAWQKERHWVPARSAATFDSGAAAIETATLPAAFYDVAWEAFEPKAGDHDAAPAPSFPTPAALHRLAETAGPGSISSGGAAVRDHFNWLAAAYISAAVGADRWTVGERRSTEGFRTPLGVIREHHQLFERLLGILAERGVLEAGDGDWLVRSVPARTDLAAAIAGIRGVASDYASELALLERCGSNLRAVLRGELNALELIFPDGAMADAERLYEHSSFCRALNRHIGQIVHAAAASMPGGRKLRVLEVGAGTGATTAHVLGALDADRIDYVFTDASPVFISWAKTKFDGRRNLRYSLLDLERAPIGPDLPRGSFDIVIAANVVHATADLEQTVGRVGDLLAPGGLLVLLEGVHPEPWVDVIFGLTPGWWKFADRNRRPAHPLLTDAEWTRVLGECGFDAADGWLDPASESLFTQSVIVARKPKTQTESSARREWLFVGSNSVAAEALAAAVRSKGDAVAGFARGVDDPVWLEWTVAAAAAVGAADRHVVYVAAEPPTGLATGVDSPALSALDSCAAVLAISQTLARLGAGVARLWIVTRGAEHVSASDVPAIDQAPLWGLARVAALEHPQVWGGIIDLDPAGSAADAAAVAGLVDRAQAEDQLAVRSGEVFVARLAAQGGIGATPPLTLRHDGVYVITGGLGSLGLKVARWMVERGAKHLVLVGRQARAAAAVQSLEAAGALVTVTLGDVSDAGWVSAFVTSLSSGPVPLRGIVHAAGVSIRKPLVELDRAALENDFAAKVSGAWLLHRATAALDLDFFILFSSAAGIWGSRDLGSYAAANHFLDALAYYRRGLGLPALSIDWGRWNEVGVTTADAQAFWDRIGLPPMTDASALDAIERLLASGATSATVAAVDWTRFTALHGSRSERPFLQRVAAAAPSEPAPVPGAQTAVPTFASFGALPAAERESRLIVHLQREVCSILGLDPNAPIDLTRGFALMGLDSLMAIDLRNRLQTAMGRALPSPVVFNYPNVRALAGYLSTLLTPVVEAGEPVDAPVFGAMLDTDIDSLSDQEAEALLAMRMAAIEREGL
jgi:acyl transferase domain-containing protein/acyl carrier protein